MVEMMIKCNGKRICIVEAKKENMKHGVVQGLTGSEVIAELEGYKQNFVHCHQLQRLVALQEWRNIYC